MRGVGPPPPRERLARTPSEPPLRSPDRGARRPRSHLAREWPRGARSRESERGGGGRRKFGNPAPPRSFLDPIDARQLFGRDRRGNATTRDHRHGNERQRVLRVTFVRQFLRARPSTAKCLSIAGNDLVRADERFPGRLPELLLSVSAQVLARSPRRGLQRRRDAASFPGLDHRHRAARSGPQGRSPASLTTQVAASF